MERSVFASMDIDLFGSPELDESNGPSPAAFRAQSGHSGQGPAETGAHGHPFLAQEAFGLAGGQASVQHPSPLPVLEDGVVSTDEDGAREGDDGHTSEQHCGTPPLTHRRMQPHRKARRHKEPSLYSMSL